jgi:acyl-coenzyme A thioesterase PaaI-like protein
MNNRSLSPPLLRRNNNNNNNNNNDVVLKEIQKKLRTDHGMGDFGDSIMRNVVVRSYNNNKRPQQQQQDGVEDIDQDEDQDHQLVLSFIVTKDLCNGFNTLHGGASATAVDIFTSVLLLLHSKYNPNNNKSTNSSSPSDGASVTSDLHVSCISPAPLGSTVICICQVNKSGRGLQFASCDIYKEVIEVIEEEVVVEETNNNSNNSNNNNTRRRRRRKLILVTKGLHTKYVLDKQRQKGFGGSGGRSRSRDGSDGNGGNDGGSGKPLLQRQRQIRSKL